MGKVEKVIVLSVLFLIALILVVSLTVDDPLDKSRIVEAGSQKGRPPAAPTAVQPGSDAVAGLNDPVKPSGLLNMSLSTAAAPNATPVAPPSPAVNDPAPKVSVATAPPTAPVAEGSALPPGAVLKTLEGLEDSILKDMKLYTWKEGDTYRVVANKYYGDGQKFTVLRRSNEGRNDLQPGDKIFVPIFDADAVAQAPVPAKGSKVAIDPAGKTDPTVKKEALKPSSGKVHVVKDGESLWKIAKQELGNGGRWEEIYELNKDIIPASKAVHTGLRLRIP